MQVPPKFLIASNLAEKTTYSQSQSDTCTLRIRGARFLTAVNEPDPSQSGRDIENSASAPSISCSTDRTAGTGWRPIHELNRGARASTNRRQPHVGSPSPPLQLRDPLRLPVIPGGQPHTNKLVLAFSQRPLLRVLHCMTPKRKAKKSQPSSSSSSVRNS
jgi:hypothetical protein